MNASDIPDECLQDPQFINVLKASLCSQIAELERILADTAEEIQAVKDKVEQGLEKRKVLKQTNKDLKQKKTVQESALESMERDGKKRSIEIEAVKNRLDDATLRQIADRAKFEKILDEYGSMWQQYKAAYEEFPLAKEREKCRTNAQKLNIERMVAEYKRDEFVKMLKQRKAIDAMRIRAAGVDVSRMVLQRWNDEKYLDYLQTVVKKLEIELKAYEKELTELREEDERARLAEIETSKMPPPRLDFSFIRSVYTSARNARKGRMTPRRDSDATSVDTLMLEELCKDAEKNGSENAEILSNASERNTKDAPLSISSIQAPEPLAASASEVGNDGIASVSVAGSNIEEGLRKLGIENSQTVPDSETPRRTDEADGENSEYQYGLEESFRRTRRWCEESRNELAPYLLSGNRSKSAAECRPSQPSDENVDGAAGKARKAFSIHGSETGITNAPSDLSGSKWFLCNEKGSEIATELTSSRCDDISSADQQHVSLLGKRKHLDSSPNAESTLPSGNYQNYDGRDKFNDEDATRASQTSNDNSVTTIDTNVNRPKIISVEKADYPLGQLSRHASAVGTRSIANFGSTRNYMSSCVSSENFSNAIESAFLQGTPQGSLMTGCEETPGYPMFTSSQNSSPRRAQSIISFTSTIIDHRLNNDGEINKPGPVEGKTLAPQPNVGGFFCNKRQAERHTMF